MPNVHLTQPMESYVQRQIRSGAYANLSEVVRAGSGCLWNGTAPASSMR